MSAEEANRNDMDKSLFINLVVMFASSVMQQLGKTIDPTTGKTQVNLDAAQMSIDILDMLAAKTKGNLSKQEGKILNDTLTALKLNYVETTEMLKKQATAKPAAPAAPAEPTAHTTPSESSATAEKKDTSDNSDEPVAP